MKDGIKPCKGLNEKELDEIKRLSLVCNKADGIRLKLNWDMLRERSKGEINDFLYYKNGALVGFLGVYSFKSSEAEISGMVHPDYRRQGIFHDLTEAAAEACRERAIPKLIFICPRSSSSGKAFLDTFGSKYSFSEYRMEMEKQQASPPQKETAGQAGPKAVESDIRLREADHKDLELLVHLNMSGFSMAEEDTREYVGKTLQGRGEKTYIAELGQIPIGKIGVQLSETSGFIYGFCVLTEYRGKGYGRTILAKTIQSLLMQEPNALLALEVAVENEGALALYQSCGFKVVIAYDYHNFPLINDKEGL